MMIIHMDAIVGSDFEFPGTEVIKELTVRPVITPIAVAAFIGKGTRPTGCVPRLALDGTARGRALVQDVADKDVGPCPSDSVSETAIELDRRCINVRVSDGRKQQLRGDKQSNGKQRDLWKLAKKPLGGISSEHIHSKNIRLHWRNRQVVSIRGQTKT